MESGKRGIADILIPVFLLGFFLASSTLSRDLLRGLGVQPLSQAQTVLSYAMEIGIWLSAAWVLSRLLTVFLWDGIVARSTGVRVPQLLKTITGVAIGSIAVTGIVGFVFNLPITGFFATSGVVGLVLGFALRNMIQDVFTGVAVNFDKPFAIGDWVTVHGRDIETTGQVVEINWRTTRLRSEDHNIVILPNSALGMVTITNHWSPAKRSRIEVTFWLDFSVPPDRAIRVLLGGVKAAVGKHGLLEAPEPQVLAGQTGDRGIEYRVRFWITPWEGTSPTVARHHVIISILQHLRHAGLSLSYPKEDLYLNRMPSRQLDARSQPDREELLAHNELFRELEKHEITELAARMRTRTFPAGTVIFRQGEPGESMHVLFEGLLHVYVEGADGEQRAAQLVPGQVFGELSLLTGDVREATIVAATDTVTYEVTKEDMEAVFRRRPALVELLATALVDRQIALAQVAESSAETTALASDDGLSRHILRRMKSIFRSVFRGPSGGMNGEPPQG